MPCYFAIIFVRFFFLVYFLVQVWTDVQLYVTQNTYAHRYEDSISIKVTQRKLDIIWVKVKGRATRWKWAMNWHTHAHTPVTAGLPLFLWSLSVSVLRPCSRISGDSWWDSVSTWTLRVCPCVLLYIGVVHLWDWEEVPAVSWPSVCTWASVWLVCACEHLCCRWEPATTVVSHNNCYLLKVDSLCVCRMIFVISVLDVCPVPTHQPLIFLQLPQTLVKQAVLETKKNVVFAVFPNFADFCCTVC